MFEFSICKLSLSLQFGHFFQMVQESLMIIYHKTTSTIAWQKEVCFSKLLLREVLAFDNQNNDWYPWSRTPPHSNIGQRARSNIVTSGVKTSRERRQVILAGFSFLAILLHLVTLVSSVCLGGNVDRAVQQNKSSSETIVFSSQTLIVKTCLTYFYVFVYVVFNILFVWRNIRSVGAAHSSELVLAFLFLKLSLVWVKVELVASIGCEYPG